MAVDLDVDAGDAGGAAVLRQRWHGHDADQCRTNAGSALDGHGGHAVLHDEAGRGVMPALPITSIFATHVASTFTIHAASALPGEHRADLYDGWNLGEGQRFASGGGSA